MENDKLNEIISKLTGISSRLDNQEARLRALEGAPPVVSSVNAKTNLYGPEVVVASAASQPTATAKPVATVTKAPTSSGINEESSGRWLGKIGVIAVLFGVAFFLKYAFDSGLIGEVGRVILGLFAGVAFIGIGQYLKNKYLVYSNVLMGGGIGILYLTIFAAHTYYNLIPTTFTFVLMLMVTILSWVLSVFGGTIHLAVLGIVGGFLTPFLIGGDGGVVGLPAYTVILDVGIVLVGLYRKWYKLNLIGFLGSILLYLAWASKFPSKEYFAATFLFATILFAFYLFITTVHHIVRGEKSEPSDMALVTLNSLWYFWVCYGLLYVNFRPSLGFFAVLLALVHFILAYLAYARKAENLLLNSYLAGLGLVFLTLAVPIELSGFWITLAWFAEAIVVAIVFALTSLTSLRTYASIIAMVGVARLLFENLSVNGVAKIVIFNHYFFIGIVGAVATALIAVIFTQTKEEASHSVKQLAAFFFVVANIICLWTLTNEVSRYYSLEQQRVSADFHTQIDARSQYTGGQYDEASQKLYTAQNASYRSINNQKNTAVSLLWALYAIILIVLGFWRNQRLLRLLGIILFFITAARVFFTVWGLGQLYRTISFIAFGIIALVGSFLYAKYKDKLKSIL